MSEKQKSDCPGSYEVSGYTTDSGKKVDSYTRHCWKHGGGASGSSVQNTRDNIEKTNEKLNEINNKETITDEDLDLSKGYLSATISKVCEDCENYLDEKENKTETPTWESIEKSKDLKNTKNKILDELEKSMSTVDKIEKIQKKNWDTIDTNDEGYNNKLYEYAKSKETIENINKNLRYLHEAVSNSWGIAKNYIDNLKTSSKNFINHGGKNGNPIWFLPEAKDKNKFKSYNNIIDFGRLWRETNVRLEKFYERPDINITDEEIDIKNDMRHITGLAFFTQMYGAQEAKNLGYTKELKDIIFEHDLDDTKIDLENNKKGIQLGKDNPYIERDKLIEKIYDEYIKPKRTKKR